MTTWKIFAGLAAAFLLLKPRKAGAAKGAAASGPNVPAGLYIDRDGARYILRDDAIEVAGAVLIEPSIEVGMDGQAATGDLRWPDGVTQGYRMSGTPSAWVPTGPAKGMIR